MHAAADSLVVVDSVSKSVTKAVSTDIGIQESITAERDVLVAASDTIMFADDIDSSVTKSLFDTVAVADGVTGELDASKQLGEAVSIQDAIVKETSRSISDTLATMDTISAIPNITIIDALGVADSVTGVPSKSVEDQLQVQDGVLIAVSMALSDPLAIFDAVETSFGYTRSVSDEITVADSADARKATPISDSLAVSETINVSRGVTISESLDLDEDVDISVSTIRLFDEVTVTDAIGVSLVVPVADSLGIADLLEASRSITISDSVGVSASLTDISWERTLALDEGLALSSDTCTPEECQLNLHLEESLGLQDEWVPPPDIEDAVAITDSVAAGLASAVQSSDSVSVTEIAETSLEAAPPDIPDTWDLTEMPRAMAVTDPALVEPPEAPKLPGTYDISAGIESLLEQTGMPVYSVSQMLSATDMAGKTLVFPAFQVSTTPTSDLPGHNVIMTPIMDVLPADTAVSFPVDISATLSEEATEHHVSWMAIDYTPGESATDFALALNMLDSKPASAQDVQAEVSAFFIDVDWAGTFAGPEEPSDPDFYTEKPDLTFAVTDDWASEQGLERDENGVPVVEMFLLNDDTGEWEEVLDIDSPSAAEDGLYTYVAHLEHFSTYVVTSELAQFGGSNVSFHVPVSFSALISDSIAVTDAQRTGAFEVIEEFTGGKNVSVGILEVLRVSIKPVGFSETLQLGRDVTVAIALDDVYTTSILPPEVRALLILEVANRSDSQEQFQLDLRYFDQTGRVAYESVEVIQADAHKTGQMMIEVPFTSAGDFVVNLDARAMDDNRLLGTAQIEVMVPWLAVNMYVIIVTAAATLAGAGATMAYILRRQKTGEDEQVL